MYHVVSVHLHKSSPHGLPNCFWECNMTRFKQHGTIACKICPWHIPMSIFSMMAEVLFYRWRACQRCIKQQIEVALWLAYYLRFIVSIFLPSVSPVSMFNSYEFCFVLCKFSFVVTNLFKIVLRMCRFCGSRNFGLQVLKYGFLQHGCKFSKYGFEILRWASEFLQMVKLVCNMWKWRNGFRFWNMAWTSNVWNVTCS